MGRWSFDPAVEFVLFASATAYLAGVLRIGREKGRAFPRRRVVAVLGGLGVVYLALQSPIDTAADSWLSVHMVQHLLLTMIAPPLILLGTPVTVAFRASPARARRIVAPVMHSPVAKTLSNPLLAWFLFLVVLWGSHYSAIYGAALRSDGLHQLEHAAYLVSSLLFWWPVVGRGPGAARLSHPARILYLFLAMAQMTFLGLAVYSSDHVWYPHYAMVPGASPAIALADQHLAGAIMWVTGMVSVTLALAGVLLDWMSKDEREAMRTDARVAVEGAR